MVTGQPHFTGYSSARTLVLHLLAGLTLWLLSGALPLTAFAQEDPRELFIELSSSDDRVYVQQQFILTVRLHFNANLIRGDLSSPEHPDAVIEQLGRQREFNRTVDGVSYRVVERRYAVFPQHPGILSLPDIHFEGIARHPRGSAYRLAGQATLFDIEVLDIPARFQGGTWLPAHSLTLTELGLPDNPEVNAGDSLNRRIEIAVQGLPGTALPPLPSSYPDSMRAYPEPARRNSVPGPDGINGSLEQSVALVPIGEGPVTLPEIRVHWWDVTTDEPRVSVLPSRHYQIQASTPPAAELPVTPPEASGDSSGSAGFWPWLSLFLAIAWGVTLWLWRFGGHPAFTRFRRLAGPGPGMALASGARQAADEQPLTGAEENEVLAFERLIRQLKNNNPAWTQSLCHWLSLAGPRPVRTLPEALAVLDDNGFHEALKHWQAEHWQEQGPGGPAGGNHNTEALMQHLHHHRNALRARRRNPGRRHSLPAFYPS